MTQAAYEKDRELLARVIDVYCREKHRSVMLCPDCCELLAYAEARLRECPYDPKPACRKCATPCYDPAMRRRLRARMRFYWLSGGRLLPLLRRDTKRKTTKGENDVLLPM